MAHVGQELALEAIRRFGPQLGFGQFPGALGHGRLEAALCGPMHQFLPAQDAQRQRDIADGGEQAEPPGLPPPWQDHEGYAGRLRAFDARAADSNDLQRILAGGQIGEFDFALRGVGPRFGEPEQPVAEANRILVQEAQRDEAGVERAGAGLDRARRPGQQILLADGRRNQFRGWRRRPGCARARHEPRDTLAGGDPDAAVGVGEESKLIAVLPQQPVLPPVMIPMRAIKRIHAFVGAGPDPAALIGSDEEAQITSAAVVLEEVVDARRRCAGIEARQTERFSIGQPDHPIRALHDRTNLLRQQTIAAGEHAPLTAAQQRHSFIGREPDPAVRAEAEHACLQAREGIGRRQGIEAQTLRGPPAAVDAAG